MRPRIHISTKKIGLSPGSVVFTGTQKVDEASVSRVYYTADSVEEGPVEDMGSLTRPEPDGAGVLWINVDGLHDTTLIKGLGERFGVHPLALEDVTSVSGRPVAVDYGTHVFASVKMLFLEDDRVASEHVSLVFGPGWVLSFQERPGDVFGIVRERIREGATRIRSRGSDYLWYALLDAIVDHYLLVLDWLAPAVEALEEEVWSDSGAKDIPQRVQLMRKEALMVRQAVRPLRESTGKFVDEAPRIVTEATKPFLQDLNDHVLQLTETVEQVREALGGVMDAHISMTSMRTNEVMKVLTVMASIFIPLTFIAGVYGMNFQHMPELALSWAYPAVWVVMVAVAVAMLVYFGRKKWL